MTLTTWTQAALKLINSLKLPEAIAFIKKCVSASDLEELDQQLVAHQLGQVVKLDDVRKAIQDRIAELLGSSGKSAAARAALSEVGSAGPGHPDPTSAIHNPVLSSSQEAKALLRRVIDLLKSGDIVAAAELILQAHSEQDLDAIEAALTLDFELEALPEILHALANRRAQLKGAAMSAVIGAVIAQPAEVVSPGGAAPKDKPAVTQAIGDMRAKHLGHKSGTGNVP